MKASELREMKTPDLQKKILDLKEELFMLKFQQATGKSEGVEKCRTIRKDIARILTVLQERAEAK
jgi:large subunit ribosomal protein L29